MTHIRWLLMRVANSVTMRLIRHMGLDEIKIMASQCSHYVTRLAERSLDIDRREAPTAKDSLAALLDHEASVDLSVNRLVSRVYDGRHPKHYMWTSHNDFIVDNVHPGERVLDIGSGASEYTLRLAVKGATVVGVDRNPERVALIQQQNQHPNLSYLVMDVMQALPDQSYDVAVCSHVLEHLDDPVEFLARLRTIVRRVIIKVPRVDSGWKKLVRKDLGMSWYDDRDHKREYTWPLLHGELAAAGWSVVKSETGLDLRVIAEHQR